MFSPMKLRIASVFAATLLATPALSAQIVNIDLSTPDSNGYVFGSAAFDWPPEGTRSLIQIDFTGLELIDATATGFVEGFATWWDAEIGAITGNNYLFAYDCALADGCLSQVAPTRVAGFVETPRGFDVPCGPATVGNCSFHYNPQFGTFEGYFRVVGTTSRSATLTVGDFTVVPEPATWALLLTGFVFMGAAIRHRRALAAFWPAPDSLPA